MRRNLILLGTATTITAALMLVLWMLYPDIAAWKELLEEGRAYMEAHPWTLILALAILPGLGFPVSPLLILFGLVLGPRYGVVTASIIGVAAHSLCSAWFYALAAGPLRTFLLRTVLKNRPLPHITQSNALRLGFMIRITPGLPYPLQNVALGAMGMPFPTYMLVSVPTTSLYTVGFIVTGGAIFEGQTGLALTGIMLIIVMILATRMYMNRAKAKNERRAHAR